MDTNSENPYVGPTTFTREQSKLFFGREREADDLISLTISNRLVLFYAQSGAGKSSLINTRLIPGLEDRGFEVLPIGRVSGDIQPEGDVDNIFVYNLMCHLDQSKEDPARFYHTKLPEFLARLNKRNKLFCYEGDQLAISSSSQVPEEAIQIWPRALIIDQFEEVFTKHQDAWQKRSDFFNQLRKSMRADPYLWVVLTLREEFIAALDPYAHFFEDKFRTRYYMERMGYDAALDAVKKPVEFRRPFEDGVAEDLVDNLRRIPVPSVGDEAASEDKFITGEYIEPVQLQVVCYQLWDEIRNLPGDHITREDLERLAKGDNLAGFINNALAEFYEIAIAAVLQDPQVNVSQRELREWFSTKLITENETRGYVFQGKNDTAGLPNEAVELLQRKFVLRSDRKPRGTWIELVHDRFVRPILQANRDWEVRNQNPILLDAQKWVDSGKDPKRLYSGTQLNAAIAYFDKNPGELIQPIKEFLDESEGLEAQRAAQRQRRLLVFSFGALIVLVALLFWSIRSTIVAQKNYGVAMTSEAGAMAQAEDYRQVISEKGTQFVEAMDQSAAQAEDYRQVISDYGTQFVEIMDRSTAQALALGYTLVAMTPSATAELETHESTPMSTATPDFQQTQLVATQTASANPLKYHTIGKSVLGNPLQVVQLGVGKADILLVGGLHSAFAPSTVKLAENLRDYFMEHLDEIPSGYSLHILTNANPDSRGSPGTLDARLNANGVDLNRNWDCAWLSEASWGKSLVSGGKSPFSEPESQALRDYILEIRPIAVVFYEARMPDGQSSPGGCGVISLFSEALASSYGRAAGYRIAAFDAYAVNGDATNWLDAQGIPAISVLLPEYEYKKTFLWLLEYEYKKTCWDPNYRAVLQLLNP